MNIAIIGCGLIGKKRVAALRNAHKILYTIDTNVDRAETLAREASGAMAATDWRRAVEDPAVDIAIIATTNNWLAPIARGAVEAGKHVLVEKPAAITSSELDPIIAAAEAGRRIVQVGFNHRFHPALQKARELVDANALGPLMFIRARYGHGGRIGYEREWRAKPDIAGGGELIDQGVHLIDLSRWFLGDFSIIGGHAHTYFWNMHVDDNAFLSLQTVDRQTAWLHVSCTEWKNLFSFEIYGRDAKLAIDGLGGSYGVERIAYYRMLPEMGPPDTTIWEYPGADVSWKLELCTFMNAIESGTPAGPGLRDARAALDVVEKIYKVSSR